MIIPFVFEESSHIYTVKNRGISVEVPGVTRVMDSSGLINYRFVRPDILERKSKLGKEVHRATKLFDDGKLDFASLDSRVIPYLDSWIAFKRLTGFVAELREFQCVAECDGMQFGMQLDACGFTGIGGRKSRETIVEIKTTVSFLPHHAIQVAGYALGLKSNKNIASPMARFLGRRRIVVQLTPRGIPKIHECADREDADCFLRALWLSGWKSRHEQLYREAA